jgi:hypothetical protein
MTARLSVSVRRSEAAASQLRPLTSSLPSATAPASLMYLAPRPMVARALTMPRQREAGDVGALVAIVGGVAAGVAVVEAAGRGVGRVAGRRAISDAASVER